MLFVLRQMPHADHDLSPYDLVYGFRTRTPLNAMYHGLYECQPKKLKVCEWVEGMAERLQIQRDTAALRAAKSRERRREYHDKGSKLREFAIEQKVLYRIPGLLTRLYQ